MRSHWQTRTRCSPTIAFPLVVVTCFVLFIAAIFTAPHAPSQMEKTYSKRRTELYDSMAADLEEHGARFLEVGSTSQKLSISDIFKVKDGIVEPILKPADPAVRAIVLYLDPQYARPIWKIVKKIVAPFFPIDVWYQDPNLYHFSMFHASHHIEPVLATSSEIQKEAHIVETIAGSSCELSIALERVVLTSTGVLLGCWQVLNGTDPAVIRKELQKSLPNAPAKQLYNEVMLHSSFARLLGPPMTKNSGQSLQVVFQSLISQLNAELHNYKATIQEMWFIEELDVLALALKGRVRERRFNMLCNKS